MYRCSTGNLLSLIAACHLGLRRGPARVSSFSFSFPLFVKKPYVNVSL